MNFYTLKGLIIIKYIDIIPDRCYILNVMNEKRSNMNTLNIAAKIKELRKKIGLSQIEFAKRVGVGLRFIRELEQGKQTVRMDKLTQVLEFLGYHLEVKKNEPAAFQSLTAQRRKEN